MDNSCYQNDSNGFTEAELKGATGSYNNHGEGIIHWFELGKLQKRYIRLTIYETFWNKKFCVWMKFLCPIVQMLLNNKFSKL